MIKYFLFIFLFCTSALASSDFTKGIEALEAKNFTQAAEHFSAEDLAYKSAALINLGIAYNQLGKTGLAVGAFRKAATFSSPLSISSKLATKWLKKLGYPTDYFSGYRFFLNKLSHLPWAFFYSLFIFLALALVCLSYKKKSPLIPLVALSMLFCLSLNKLYFNQQTFGTLHGKVIELRSGPSSESSIISEAIEGDFAQILSSKENWFAVKVSESRQGWLSKNFIIFH